MHSIVRSKPRSKSHASTSRSSFKAKTASAKKCLPRIIHDASARKGKKYLALNCGALPEGTIDSELFGHVKGAFTGSVDSREGYFSAADGGTLFLDEVGELPLQTQVRLLRVLETGEFIPVGSSEVKRSNVRIVAATNVDMQRAIAEGRFREDLYYRLAAVSIQMPPLRERGADIDMLFRKFALEISEQYKIPPSDSTTKPNNCSCTTRGRAMSAN